MTSHSTDSLLPNLRTAEDLEKYLATKGITWTDAHLPNPSLFRETFRVNIPIYYANLINWTNPSDPLKLMVIPDPREKNTKDYELTDPIGDRAREVVPGLLHRYPDRCLLLLTSYCLVHCRFCFRRETVGKVRPVQFQKIQAYLTDHHEVSEIIFSGGDPFTFPIGFLESVIQHLAPLEHIQKWRFHSRVPVVNPLAVSAEWIEQLHTLRSTYHKKVRIIIHINHPREITPEFIGLVKNFKDAGCEVLSQTVLLKKINTDTQILAELFTNLHAAGVTPYQLHHLDQVVGSHHFRVSIEKGKQIFASLDDHISSENLPRYMLDLPGGFGKVEVKELEDLGNRKYQVKTFEGLTIQYQDHADPDSVVEEAPHNVPIITPMSAAT